MIVNNFPVNSSESGTRGISSTNNVSGRVTELLKFEAKNPPDKGASASTLSADTFEKSARTEAKPLNRPDNYIAPNAKIPGKADDVHFFFFSDAHARFALVDKFIDRANKEKPDLVIDGGDIIHDATSAEFAKSYTDREKIEAPLYMVTGNHDLERRGEFDKPVKEIPPFQSFDFKGTHFILIDDAEQKISEEVFKQLEADLEQNKGKRIVVSMHVPAMSSNESFFSKIVKNLPFGLAWPTLKDPQEAERFTGLMSKYQVKAVLAGHTHKADDFVKDGVRYITSAPAGGVTPGLNIQNEYLDLKLSDNGIDVKRVPLQKASGNPLAFVAKTVDYYQDINTFNHENIGWNYVPSTGIQYQAGMRVSETKNGESVSGTVALEMEKNNGEKGKSSEFVALKLGLGAEDLNAQVGVGIKYRVLGDFNKNVFVAGSGSVNGGIVTGKLSGGAGVGLAAGVEYKNLTVTVGQEWATNYKATSATIGYRF